MDGGVAAHTRSRQAGGGERQPTVDGAQKARWSDGWRDMKGERLADECEGQGGDGRMAMQLGGYGTKPAGTKPVGSCTRSVGACKQESMKCVSRHEPLSWAHPWARFRKRAEEWQPWKDDVQRGMQVS